MPILILILLILSSSSNAQEDRKMMIYSQKDGSLLGCINCREGLNVEFDDLEYSPCNPEAKRPPIIKDEFGHEYGELNIDISRPNVRLGAGMKRFLETFVCD